MVTTYKAKILDQLKKEITGSEAVIIIGYKGLNVESFNRFRSGALKFGGKCRVVKNSLIKKVFSKESLEGLSELVSGESAVITSKEKDVLPLIKMIAGFTKENEKLQMKGGLVEKNILNGASLTRYAKLPSRIILLTQLAVTVKSPLYRLATVLNGPIVNLARVLKLIEKQKIAVTQK